MSEADIMKAMLDARFGVVQSYLVNLVYALTPVTLAMLFLRFVGDKLLGFDIKESIRGLKSSSPLGHAIVVATIVGGVFYLLGGIAAR
jgi:hypothetical protein